MTPEKEDEGEETKRTVCGPGQVYQIDFYLWGVSM